MYSYTYHRKHVNLQRLNWLSALELCQMDKLQHIYSGLGQYLYSSFLPSTCIMLISSIFWANFIVRQHTDVRFLFIRPSLSVCHAVFILTWDFCSSVHPSLSVMLCSYWREISVHPSIPLCLSRCVHIDVRFLFVRPSLSVCHAVFILTWDFCSSVHPSLSVMLCS